MNHSKNKAIAAFYILTICLFAGLANTGYSASCMGNIIETSAGAIDFGFINSLEKIPGLVHHVAGIDDRGTVALDNQSQWSTSDIELVKSWKAEDDLYLTQNQAFFSVHRFALVNPRLQKAVPISLLREPLPVEDKTHFIAQLDLANDVVTLLGGAEYLVFPNDHGTLKRYVPNDRIMIGFNSSDRLDSNAANAQCNNGYLLIDTAYNSYVRAHPVQK